ncbi:MAG: response regulator, partial [Planctomycetota bacterium]
MNRDVLLADDEATFRETFAKVLREEGMSVTAVGNGTDAIDAVTKEPFGVVVLDIRMPGADGIKVLREIMR